MPRSKKWVAVLAAGGATVGAVVALDNAPAVSSTPANASAKRQATTEAISAASTQLAGAVAQVNQLQSRIDELRKGLLAEENSPQAAGGSRYIGRMAAPSGPTASGSAAAFGAWQARLRSEQSQLAAEQGQLMGEQAALESEKNALAQGAGRLEAEQEQLAQEEHRLATTPAVTPATHTTTGASGSTGSDN